MVSAKKRLIILSDLWGKESSDWLTYYTNDLETDFEVVFYDSRELGSVNNYTSSKKLIHQAFVQSGIDKAVDTLLKKERESLSVLAFSVGGTIAWKAALKGLKTDYFHALSATRIRFETQKPKTKITLHYGEDDVFVPDRKWFDLLGLEGNFHKNKSHDFYKEKEIAKIICSTLKSEQKDK